MINSIVLLPVILTGYVNAAAIRSYNFNAHVKNLPLLRSLPNHTAIYHEWPPKQLRKTIPDYIAAAVVTHAAASATSSDDESSNSNDNDGQDDLLVGPPIHVQVGDTLRVTLKNSLQTTGLSLHWHGFEMSNALEYDGVVGVTQCPIAPATRFVYEFEVAESQGSYWWHTHSGLLGLHAVNSIQGPLIVHPKGDEKKELVDRLNNLTSNNSTATEENPWYYENERILFFKDGFTDPNAIHLVNQMGGLNEVVSKDKSGLTVSSSPWEFGTCNGKMREIVPVSPGKTYKFRLINGGTHYGLRINIANLKMKVVAADSEPVEPVHVDEVFIHTAERFDVEVTIPDDWDNGESFWIRADTLESAYQGYQNGIRAILKVSKDDDNNDHDHDAPGDIIYDPMNDDIKSSVERSKDHLILNCFERETLEIAPYGGRCLDISTLARSKVVVMNDEQTEKQEARDYYFEQNAIVHTIDSHFQPYPQHSHFIRFDDGHYLQHVNPMKAMLLPSFGPQDMHPHTAVLHVPSHSTVLLAWRTTSLMDHPMHLHGLKMEIIGVALPNRQEDCTLSKCKLNTFYESKDDVRDLAASIPLGSAVMKDTFIVPAGGAVVTRIHTKEPNLWYAHCHIEMHHFDGMAFILNVGNYSGSVRSLPEDYPSCDSPFSQTHKSYPSCDCYENPNTVLSTYLTSDYKCSRDHLCHHVHSRAANLERYHYVGGDDIHSAHDLSGYAISFISLALVALIVIAVRYHKALAKAVGCDMTTSNPDQSEAELENGAKSDSSTTSIITTSGIGIETTGHTCCSENESRLHTAMPLQVQHSSLRHQRMNDDNVSYTKQLLDVITEESKSYRPLCVSFLRVVEVSTLAMLTGFLYYDVGNDTSFTGLSQRLGLFFFSTTLWTFTRMYPAVGFSHQWFLSRKDDLNNENSSIFSIVLGRLLVVLGLESFWPLLYVLVCYPFAGVFGSFKIVVFVGLFLVLNNLCYISLGSVLGVYSRRVPQGMIASTIFSQTSLVAAGFYTKLPPALDWIRYISPFYWTFRGILKSCFKWNDSLECFKGNSEVGSNQCYLEQHAAIDQYKERGINVATFNDASSNSLSLEFAALVTLLVFLNSLIFVKVWYLQVQASKISQVKDEM